MKQLFILLTLFVCAGSCLSQTGTIRGTVTDKQTGYPLAGINIVVENTFLGAATNSNGFYEILNVPVGEYSIKATAMGYQTETVKAKVKAKKPTIINFVLLSQTIESEQNVVFYERKLCLDKASTMGAAVSFQMPPAPRQQEWNTEEYSFIDESGFLDVLKRPLSTFAADVDYASYTNARRFIMQDQLPYPDVVRTEEFINYFDYDYHQPKVPYPLSINLEYSECPWDTNHKLVHIGLQGKQLEKSEQKPSNLVFLLDVSGSMSDLNKLPLVKRSFRMLVEQLSPKDRVAIVVYAGAAGLVLPSTPGSQKEKIMESIDRLEAGGSTAGGAGIQLAYNVAKENFIRNGNNRVILATDGDFNIGISSTSELVRFIEEKRDFGIFLTVLGFGMGNYKDNRLQELADRGNGHHAYIDNILEAKKVFVNEITSTLFTIAKDVKIQVEFNPKKVQSYRLLGYENRELQDKDFTDDKKDAGEIGAGHTVTALYEIIPAFEDETTHYDLKYIETTIKNNPDTEFDILTVRIRYKEPDGDKSKEISRVVKGYAVPLEQTSDNFRFSAAVAEFAMILRDSEFKGDSSLEGVKELALSAKGDDKFGYRAEFLNLVDRVNILKGEQLSEYHK